MIIGLCGFINCGKGTVADMLVSKGFVKESFANPLKDTVSSVFGWPRELLEGDTVESREFREKKDEWWSEVFGYDVTPRLMLQKVGTEVMRENLQSEIWLLSFLKRTSNNPDKNYVVADVRFPNEIERIRNTGGKIVEVRRGPPPIWWRYAYADMTMGTTSVLYHPTNSDPYEIKAPKLKIGRAHV